MKKRLYSILLIVVLLLALVMSMVAGHGAGEAAKFGLWSLLPPLIAIALALISKQVILSLFLGVFVGAIMLNNGNLFYAFLRTLDNYMLAALADKWHAGILIFTITIGGMVGVIAKMGGNQAIAEALSKKAKTAKSAQVATWLMGLVIFFDDYSNTLIVGPTMKPLTDKMKVSREKLSYIVDSTAAPITGMALISTWVGYELGLLGDAFKSINMDVNAYEMFLKTIPYRFYDIFTLIMVLIIALKMKDFGPMYKAEKRARLTGKVLDDNARPMAFSEIETLDLKPGIKAKISNAVVPIASLIILGFVGLWYSGGGVNEPFTLVGIRTAFGNADASIALLWSAIASSIIAIVMAVSQKILTINEAFDSFVDGCKSLMITAIILLLAWSLGKVTEDVGTANFLVGAITSSLPAMFLPLLVFLISCVVSFATGTSWGTMAIMLPLAVPLANAFLITGSSETLLMSTIASVLTGAIFGDHCSPISDTTIMSSMASGSDHIDHVKTQMPYALTVAIISICVGYIPAGLGLPAWVSLLLGVGAIWAVIHFFGKSTKIEDLEKEIAIENKKNKTFQA